MNTPLEPRDRGRKNTALVLQAMAVKGQGELAKAMGVAESTISRWKGDDIGQFATVLAYLGLKVVPVGVQCFDPAYVESLRELARHGIEHGPRALDWSDTQ